MFKSFLYNILDEVNSFEPKSEVMERLVSEKLNFEFDRYTNELTSIVEYLLKRDKIKVLRRMTHDIEKRRDANDQSN